MTTFRSHLRLFATTATCLAITAVLGQTNNIAINRDGAAPNSFAILDVQSTLKGVLIPRMLNTERDLIAAPAQGLTVYVTAPNAEEGFWYYDNAMWNRIMPGAQWGLTGDAGTVPGTLLGQNYLGTSDTQPLIFRTNGVERARVDLQGDLGIGVVNPLEKLDLLGAIKQTGTAAGFAAGTIRYTTYNALLPIAPFGGYTYSQHEGNLNGTATGWRKIENDYTEVRGAAYTAAGSPVACGPGTVDLGTQNGTNNTDIVTPWNVITTAAAARYRHQYLFRPNELNVELNQIFNNPAATQGICCGAQISSISFYVSTYTGAKTGAYSLQIKHSSFTSLTGFDDGNDPANRCATVGIGSPQPNTPGVGWKTFTFATPFVWDCTRGIVIDIKGAAAAAGVAANNTVWVTTGLGFNGSYGTWGTAACGITGACGVQNTASCGGIGGSNIRPVVRFTMANSGVATAPPATISSGDYVHYTGALLAEGGTPPPSPNWSQWNADNVPVGDTYYAYKGPGRISAQSGVYDDQVRLSDHVFDRHFDGKVMPQDAVVHGKQRNFSMEEMAAFTEQQRHLPTMKGRSEWDARGGFSLGDITNQLWVTTETQALYLTQLNKRLDGLSVLSGTGPIDNTQLDAAKTAIAAMGTLTEGEKATLVQGCQSRLTALPTNR